MKKESRENRQKAIDALSTIENDDVIATVMIIIGDYLVSGISAKKRAAYLHKINYYAASTETVQDMKEVAKWTAGASKAVTSLRREKGGVVNG